MTSLKIPLTGVTSDWSKARCQNIIDKFDGLTPWMGVWIGGLIANEGKSKVKSKIKYNKKQKKSKCINYVIMDSVFAKNEFDCSVSLILIVTVPPISGNRDTI